MAPAKSPVVADEVVKPLQATVGFQRKVSVRQYESAEASIFIQTEVDLNDPDLTMKNLKHALMQATSLVYEQLGITFQLDEGGIVRELLNKHLGPVTEVKSNDGHALRSGEEPFPTSGPAPAPAAGGDGPPFDPNTKDRDEKAANKAWAMADFAANPQDWYDNRGNKKSERSPDAKHKKNGLALWL